MKKTLNEKVKTGSVNKYVFKVMKPCQRQIKSDMKQHETDQSKLLHILALGPQNVYAW